MAKNSPANTLAILGQAYAKNDLNLALSVMTENVLWNISGPPEVPYLGVFYGHDGFSRFWWLLHQTVDFHDAGVHTTLFGENCAVALGGESGVTRLTGAPYHYDWAIEYIFNETSQIVRMRQYFDPSAISAALGAHYSGAAKAKPAMP
jgi:ketosteroid isomerase-like protein